MNFKNIHIGTVIKQRVEEMGTETMRISKFLRITEKEIEKMYKAKSLDVEILLRWSKLLEYDFFRIYSQHLILYSPPSKNSKKTEKIERSSIPSFRKNIYTKEIIDFILNSIDSGEKTKKQIIDEYKIPKTTLHKWIMKYKK